MELSRLTKPGMATLRSVVVGIGVLLITCWATYAIAEDLLFKQPSLTKIEGNFCVRCAVDPGRFHITQWESSPTTTNGGDLASAQNMESYTGLPAPPVAGKSQVSVSNKPGASGAQVSGEAVGAFIKSSDLAPDTPEQKFIITPSIEFNPPVKVFMHPSPTDGLVVSFDLQVPSATDQGKPRSSSYVVSDLMFRNRDTGTRIYVNTIVFKNNTPQPRDSSFFDGPTSTAAAVGPITGNTEFARVEPTSQPYQSRPWTGWKHFSYAVSGESLKKAIVSVNRHYGSLDLSGETASWDLISWHLNAEVLFGDGPAELGWSLRRASIVSR
jgi:hypothetical protein